MIKARKEQSVNMKLSVGFSPCPNDTHIFYAMTAGQIDLRGFEFDIQLEDVETLNKWAEQQTLDITKLSFAALGHVLDRYVLINAGAALGHGCGPLIVARPGFSLDRLDRAVIAVPGRRTTACLLLGLFLGKEPYVVPMRFDEIMPAVAAGRFEAGVIIHEGRLTYHRYGLEAFMDLGQWWEDETGLPIPLGGIAVRRNLQSEYISVSENILRASVRFARTYPAQTLSYVQAHAQELSPEVIREHIRLYVNDYTEDLGDKGINAVNALFYRARAAGLIPAMDALSVQ